METKMSASMPSDVEMPCQENKQIRLEFSHFMSYSQRLHTAITICLLLFCDYDVGDTFGLNITRTERTS